MLEMMRKASVIEMKNISEELTKIADELKEKEIEMIMEVREAGAQTQDGFDRVLRAIHRLNRFASKLPAQLHDIAIRIDQERGHA